MKRTYFYFDARDKLKRRLQIDLQVSTWAVIALVVFAVFAAVIFV